MQIAPYEKSLAYLYPEKLAEWDYQKNNILPEKIFSKNSTEQIWWLCPKCNHSYSATLSNRIGRKSGCPKCSLIVIGVKKSTPKEGESLLERFPEICKDWSSNNKTSPKQYYPFSHKKVLWFCKKCKKDYLGSIGHKVGKRGCPRCKEKYVGKCNSTPKIGESLLDLYPEICKEWSNKNEFGPETYKRSCNTKAWWKCSKCNNEWEATPNKRTNANRSCPKCSFSKGEKLIEKYLIDNNIEYKAQFRIKECRDKLPLPFDFAIWINSKLCLIEYNGYQHYNEVAHFKSHNIEYITNHDKIKVDYCNQNNIPLLVIPYTEYSNIEQIILDWLKCLDHTVST